MTDFSVIKIGPEFKASTSQKKPFFLPREFSILNELEMMHSGEEISAGRLVGIGLFSAGVNQAAQAEAWGIPIKRAIKVSGNHVSYVFERDAIIDLLGKSYFVPLNFIGDCIPIPAGRNLAFWAKENRISMSLVSNKSFVIREQAKRLVIAAKRDDSKIITPSPMPADSRAPSPTVSGGDLFNHSQELIEKNDNHVPPPPPVMDLAPRGAPLVTTLDEVNLTLLKQIRDMLERCECLLKDADHSYEVLIKQNRHIFKHSETTSAGVKALLQELNIQCDPGKP